MPEWPCLLCLPGLPRVQLGISAQLQQAWAGSCVTMLCVLCWWVQGKEGIDSVLHLMRDYCIGREDIDFITGGWASRWWARGRVGRHACRQGAGSKPGGAKAGAPG